MSGGNNIPMEAQSFGSDAKFGDSFARPNSSLTASTSQAYVAPRAFDGVNWFDNNSLQKWRDLHLLKIHHINIVESLNFLPEQTRKNLFLRLNEVGWPLRLRTLETAGSSIMSIAGAQWFQEDRNALVVLRQFGLSWTIIANTFFAGHTAQDCMDEVIRLGHNPITLAMTSNSTVVPAAYASLSSPNIANSTQKGQKPASSTPAPGFFHHQALPVSATPSSSTLVSAQPRRPVNTGSTTFVNHLSSSWTVEEDTILREAYNKGIKYTEIRDGYLPHRTAKAMNTRMYRLRQLDDATTSKVGQ